MAIRDYDCSSSPTNWFRNSQAAEAEYQKRLQQHKWQLENDARRWMVDDYKLTPQSRPVPKNVRHELHPCGEHTQLLIRGEINGKMFAYSHIIYGDVEMNEDALNEIITYAVNQFFRAADAAFEKEHESVHKEDGGWRDSWSEQGRFRIKERYCGSTE